jgi:hypothetical protein
MEHDLPLRDKLHLLAISAGCNLLMLLLTALKVGIPISVFVLVLMAARQLGH